MLDIFQPLKVRDGDTTTIAQDIGKEADTFFQQNFLAFASGGTVGSFNDQFALEPVSVVAVDGLLKGSRDEDVAKNRLRSTIARR